MFGIPASLTETALSKFNPSLNYPDDNFKKFGPIFPLWNINEKGQLEISKMRLWVKDQDWKLVDADDVNPKNFFKSLNTGLFCHPWPALEYDPNAVMKSRFLLVLGAAPVTYGTEFDQLAMECYQKDMKPFRRYEICPSQNELLSLKLEVQLFRSLINNNIKEIKDTKIEDREEISVEDKEEKSVQDRYCKFLLLFVNCFSGKQSIPKVARKDDIIDWDFRQIYEALPHQRYGDFWPRDEMMRTLLCENLKMKVSQSDVFLHLFGLCKIDPEIL
ncbi:unnamed protein product [Oikopleura dioica]|uniref:Uncharacterized protein n=1 Tax=Oikopleura dioica TaxID=34765 RepID=E4Y2V1_OIKDI|nr:unnamed protein product [Oikopleura dioica]